MLLGQFPLLLWIPNLIPLKKGNLASRPSSLSWRVTECSRKPAPTNKGSLHHEEPWEMGSKGMACNCPIYPELERPQQISFFFFCFVSQGLMLQVRLCSGTRQLSRFDSCLPLPPNFFVHFDFNVKCQDSHTNSESLFNISSRKAGP